MQVAYSTYGALCASRDNGVVVGHSLTSNSVVHEWWGEMMGDGDRFAIDTAADFVVCVNYLGSPYGTTSPWFAIRVNRTAGGTAPTFLHRAPYAITSDCSGCCWTIWA